MCLPKPAIAGERSPCGDRPSENGPTLAAGFGATVVVPLADTVAKRTGSSYGSSMLRDYAHSPLKIEQAFIVGDRMDLSNRSGQLAAMPTIGWFRWVPPIEPSNWEPSACRYPHVAAASVVSGTVEVP